MRNRAIGMRELAVACAMAALLAGSVSAARAEIGRCISADVPETFVLPGGAEFEPAKLTLCRNRQFSPARALLVGYVDRAAVGMLYALPEIGEAADGSEPFVLFVRDEEGKLHLRGYAVTCRDGMESFSIEGLGRERIRVLTRTGSAARLDSEVSTVLVPARSVG